MLGFFNGLLDLPEVENVLQILNTAMRSLSFGTKRKLIAE